MCNQTNSDKKNSVSPVKEVALGNLFTVCQYQIPLYQRSFAWTANEVKQLLDDLYNHFDIENQEKKYYLGNVIVKKALDNKYLYFCS